MEKILNLQKIVKISKIENEAFTSIFRKSFDNWKYCTDEDIILGTRLVLSRK